MKYALKTFLKLKEYLQLVVLWIVAFLFYGFMTYSMIDDSFFLIYGIDCNDFLLSELTVALIVGVSMGTILFLVQELVYPRFFRRYGMLRKTLLRSFLFVAISFSILLTVIALNKAHYITISNWFALQTDLKWLICFALYCWIVHIVFTLLQAFRRRLGNRYFINLLRGNYRIPIVEYRIFMFLELSVSPTDTEQTKDYSHSFLLQECFADLAETLPDYDAEVCQYVGDEVILSWKVQQGFNRQQCIRLYESFGVRLLEKNDFYRDQFGFVPKFKASINEGLVTVAEIGQIKTEIAYHGDVLSTAARVLDLCSDYQANLLITQSFFEQLSSLDQNYFTAIETTVLRGKKRPVTIYKSCC
ncbi:adenylate/guanylate cyclase domain-containing protein [Flavobacterium sp.]|uniref:adenylate/guanylate cyclase domain-containing protein n=1 Tax=Flavobacterium sp. TaxID=239 RepID=UPI003D0E019B